MKALRSLPLLALSFVFMCTASDTLWAQRQHDRERVGVALSGGGALGLAHIGVIRYFEEHRIPIDDIAGTSMGGLVGGFYAAGMNSADLIDIVNHADWNALLNPNRKFIDQPIVEKQNWNRASGNLTLRFGKNFSLPAGLNSGESLALFLSRNMAAYSDLSNFDELPTPFRCLATDLISGDAVVFRRGSIAKAMRATMSIPAIFIPVKWDGMVLVDGAIVENIPVEVVREMGAKAVIAVALKEPQAKQEQFNSLIGVLRQSVAVAIAQNERRSLAMADIVISVDTTRFSGIDYSKASEIIQAGYDAARANENQLAKFELSPEEWDQFVRIRQERTRHAPRQGPVVAVTAGEPSFQEKARAELRRKLDDRIVTEQRLEDVLNVMVAATGVPGASYSWGRAANGVQGYEVQFSQRPGVQLLATPSVEYEFSPGEPSRAALKLSTTTIFQDAYKSRLLSTATIGYDSAIRAEYYYPFGGSAYFIAPDLFVERKHFISYQGKSRQSETRDRFGGAFYGGIGTWGFLQFRLGLQAGYDSYSASPIVDGVPAGSGAFAAPEFGWNYNSQDSGGFPTRGTRDAGSVGYIFRQVSYPSLQNDFSTVHPWGRNLSLFAISKVETSFGTKLNFFEQFTAGGFNYLSAFRYQEFHANTALTGGGGIFLHARSVHALSLYPSLAVWYEAGRLDLGSQGWQTHQSTSSGIFFPTPLGAAGFALSINEAGKARFRVIVGSF